MDPGILVLVSFNSCNQATGGNSEEKDMKNDTLSITVLQTADIHGQLDPHPELFWENEEIVFKERGGLANIKTLFEENVKRIPVAP
jgi:S-sulfosulfanyl-L-cysteine sulfohydrolase